MMFDKVDDSKKKIWINILFSPFFPKTTIPDSNLDPKLESLETQRFNDKKTSVGTIGNQQIKLYRGKKNFFERFLLVLDFSN